ncbi:hypothetical protein K3495_g9819 [Podosphaera aphanis]|nr:hypothetical protein K3495_g9819 [Podosphaera aphanis]
MRMFLAFAALNNSHIRYVDITAAFLHAEIDRPIYIEQPHGREKSGDLVCKLHKAIYGLKKAPRRWQLKLRQVLNQMGIKSLEFDTNVFRYKETIISTYVDDFMIISESELQTHQTASALGNTFRVKDLGTMTKFLGINIEQNSDGIQINHQDKVEVLCEDMKMDNCKGANTPVADDNLIDCDIENSCSKDDAALYRSAVGTLLHIANMT